MSAFPVLAAFLRRDWATELSYRAALVLELASTILTLALFFYLARVVNNTEFGAHQNLQGGYFGYVAVGLALLRIVQVSLSSFSQKLRDEQTTGTLEALMVTPTSSSVIILASAAYDVLRATVSGLVVIAAAVLLFGLNLDTDPVSLAAAVAALAGCVALFTSLGIVVAAFTVVFKRTTGLLTLIATGLALLGGVYFPIEVLPGPIESLAKILPFTWGLDVARAGLLNGDVDPLQLGGLIASAAVLIPAALMTFRAAVWQARRTGTLAQY